MNEMTLVCEECSNQSRERLKLKGDEIKKIIASKIQNGIGIQNGDYIVTENGITYKICARCFSMNSEVIFVNEVQGLSGTD